MLLATPSQAQIQQAWVAKYNNGITNGTHQALKLVLDDAGNIYVTGFSQNASSNLGYATLKYASNGTQLWAARYDSTNTPNATPAAMAVDTNGAVLVTGSATTVKYDTNGNQLWAAPYAGTALAVDSSANVFVTGYSNYFSTVKLAPSGTNLWTATYPTDAPLGQAGQAIAVDAGGDSYVSGYYTWNCNPPPYSECFVAPLTIKYDPDGAQLWAAAYITLDTDNASSLQVSGSELDASGDLYLLLNLGYWLAPYTTLKYSATGSLLWEASNPTGNDASVSHGMAVNTLGQAVVTGQNVRGTPNTSYGTYMIATNGAYVWTNNYRPPFGQSVATAIAVDGGNGTYVTGYSPNATSNNDIVTIKYNVNGTQVWLQRYDGPAHGNDAGNAIAVDNSGNLYVAGYESVVGGGTEMVLIKYSPFTIEPESNGSVLLQLQGAPGQTFDFQASANLQTWQDLGTATAATNGAVQFLDTNAPLFPYRFYITNPQ